MSSPTGASWKSAIDLRTDSPVRIEDRRLVIASEGTERLGIEHAGLAKRFDRGRPGPTVVAVAILDLDGHPGGCRPVRVDAWTGQDRHPAQGLHPGLADDAALGGLHERRVEAVVAAADHLRVREHRVPNQREGGRERPPRVLGGDGFRVRQQRVRLCDLSQREGVRLYAAAVDRGPQPLRGRAVGPRDRAAVGRLGRMLGLPVRLEIPALEPGQEQRDRVLARAHVADRAGLLAIPRKPGGGQRVERHPLIATGQQRLADASSPEHALDRPDVEVLATVRAGHDRELGWLQVEFLEAAGLDQGDDTERLDGRAESDDPVRVAELADEPAADVRFDDVAAVDALLDAVAQLADEDRRLGTGASLRARPAVPGRRALGSGGHAARIPRRGREGAPGWYG